MRTPQEVVEFNESDNDLYESVVSFKQSFFNLLYIFLFFFVCSNKIEEKTLIFMYFDF